MLSPIAERLIISLALGLALAGPVAGHGAFVEAEPVTAVGVHARFDTGAPMENAQVSVFAPDDPATPWLTGQADAAGQFVFTPDAKAGRWAIQVRQAGHGAMGYVEVGGNGADSLVITAAPGPAGAPGAGTTLTQRLIMVACVLWGALGTALYLRRPRHKGAA